MEKIPGGICAVRSVRAAGSCKDEYGVAVIFSRECTAAAVFTSNNIKAAPVIWSKKSLKDGKISAIVANSGNANCFTGENGLKDSVDMAGRVSELLKLRKDDVAVASTGIIGRKLPMEIINTLISNAISKLDNSSESSKNAAEAIMTTDTFPKEFAVKTKLKTGENVRIGGITKGSGMVAPNMGTMLCFITTDVKASAPELKESLKKAVDNTFNMVVIDGDVSTNDMVTLMADNTSGQIDENFQEALEYLCSQLALMMVKDGEGATKLMEVQIKGALTVQDARKAARSIVKSPLVKTALFGADPNWGRIIAAVGYSGAEMDEKIISVSIANNETVVHIVKNGAVEAYEGSEELEMAEDVMNKDQIKIMVDLSMGECEATAYGCDLSYDYVRINSEYTT